MQKIISNIKDDVQIVLLPSCFVGHPEWWGNNSKGIKLL